MTIHDSNKNEVAWTSWLPALGYALAKSTGPVLEIGVGHFSTPFLHEYCEAARRNLISYETNHEWGRSFYGMFSKNHTIVSPDSYDVVGELDINLYSGSVALIDNSPGGSGRSVPFRLLLPICAYVVVHDYHRENEEAIAPILKETGASFRVFNDYQPPTLLASVKHKI